MQLTFFLRFLLTLKFFFFEASKQNPKCFCVSRRFHFCCWQFMKSCFFAIGRKEGVFLLLRCLFDGLVLFTKTALHQHIKSPFKLEGDDILSALFYTQNDTFGAGASFCRIMVCDKKIRVFIRKHLKSQLVVIRTILFHESTHRRNLRLKTHFVNRLFMSFHHHSSKFSLTTKWTRCAFPFKEMDREKKCPTFFSTFSSSWQGEKLMINTHPNRVLKWHLFCLFPAVSSDVVNTILFCS